MTEISTARLETTAAVRAVLDEPDHLSLAVQPIIDAAHLSVAGYEVLTRLPPAWEVGPDDFFAVAESLGCSVELSVLLLSKLETLRTRCPPNCFLTVNLSPSDLADARVQAQFTRSWSGLILELTEAAWPKDEDAVLAGVEAARHAGAMIASDDAGAGYAGLLQLVRVRPDLIKVDRGLVRRLGSDPAAETVLRLLGELASELDAWLLAEGIETETELGVVMRLGVPLLQGWIFGKAQPPWPSPPDLSRLRQLRLRCTFTETVAAFLRDARPAEVRCDHSGRPLAVDVAGTWVPAMTMAASTTVSSAVGRALHRSDRQHRLAPLAVTDRRGNLIGLVDVEPLVLALDHRRGGAVAAR
ncbi:MAG TPA: EAL domain-containing protein [Nocardioidaceae bacterium]|nr:EAL domain-containing protein [Nocardioidaceae bacterium]